ncbi:MAG: hypothetical protein ABH840_01190 [Nanoarchaeota archaeon]
MIKFDDFAKLDLRVATVEVSNKKKKILINEQEFTPDFEINAKTGDKIVVGMMEEAIVVLVTDKIHPVFLDGDIENGSRIS